MIKKTVKNERGITMLTLVIAVIMMAILTVALSMNSHTSLNISKLTKLQNDIEMLNDRIAVYYVKNGKLPIYRENDDNYKVSKESLVGKFDDLMQSDGAVYYTIDLSALETLSLNYGQDYRNSESNNRYIVNQKTHTVYYIEGIIYDGETYHTTGKIQ